MYLKYYMKKSHFKLCYLNWALKLIWALVRMVLILDQVLTIDIYLQKVIEVLEGDKRS